MAFGAHEEFTLGKPAAHARHRGRGDCPLQESPLSVPAQGNSRVVSGIRLTPDGIKDESKEPRGETMELPRILLLVISCYPLGECLAPLRAAPRRALALTCAKIVRNETFRVHRILPISPLGLSRGPR